MEPMVRNSITERVVFTGVWTPDEPRAREQDDQRERQDDREPAVSESVSAAR
jgi:hypothetical protein